MNQLLTSTRKADRLRAAKAIGKQRLHELGGPLAEAFAKELQNPKAWDAQSAMVESLGLLEETSALPLIESICAENKEHDLVTNFAARALVRIKRADIRDIGPIRQLLGFGGFSVVSGTLWVIGEDEMMFSDDEVRFLLDFASNHPTPWFRGLMDIRNGLAVACANWPSHLTTDFLFECAAQADDPTLAKRANQALVG